MSRKAFTLIELLVVMMILSILASIVLFALASVTEDAKAMKTRATIQKLSVIVMEKYEAYRTRRVPIAIPAGTTPRVAAQTRLDALHELMRIEMPDRYSDIVDAPVKLPTAPSIQQRYKNKLVSTRTDQFQTAECLYLFITQGSGNPDVMEQFSNSEIGDTDGDGMPEFHDGWDRPINFLRWAPGFNSPLQPWKCGSTVAAADKVYPTSHDPFDPLHIYGPSTGDLLFNPALPASAQVNPPLFPLVYSPGPDHTSEILDGGGSPIMRYSTTSPPNNPYVQVAGGLIGEWLDVPEVTPPPPSYVPVDDSVDNITNHSD